MEGAEAEVPRKMISNKRTPSLTCGTEFYPNIPEVRNPWPNLLADHLCYNRHDNLNFKSNSLAQA
jgi:hypothetical protein